MDIYKGLLFVFVAIYIEKQNILVFMFQTIGEFYSPGSVMEKDQTVVTSFEC